MEFMKERNSFDRFALVLVIAGGLNWGFVGLLSFDPVAAVLGEMSVHSRTVYILMGIMALYLVRFESKK